MIWAYTIRDFKIVFRDVGNLLKLSSVAFLIPAALSLFLEFGSAPEITSYYLMAGAITFLIGIILHLAFNIEDETRFKHAFFIVTIVWLLFTFLASLPFIWILSMSPLDAYFETMSALTTTGLSVMTLPAGKSSIALLDIAPASLIFWRSFLSWIGGLGIVLLAMLGVFGCYTRASRLIIAEGREERLKANLMNSVREIWVIYIILTIIGVVLLYLSGMEPLDAVNYSMSAISTTGMTTTGKGLAVQNNFWVNEGVRNYWVDISLIIIMLFGATSFYVHSLFKKKGYKAYFKDAELRGLLLLGLVFAIFIVPHLGAESAFFHSFSAITCGGFALVPEPVAALWPDFAKLILIAAMFIGGSSGSTAGGIKMARFLIFIKSIWWKAKETLLPKNAMFARKFEGMPVDSEHIKEICLFILLYIVFIFLGVFVLTFNGENLTDALFEVVSAQGNAGISVGVTHPGMNPINEIMLIINMFVGRLEIIPIFSLLGIPAYLRGRKKLML